MIVIISSDKCEAVSHADAASETVMRLCIMRPYILHMLIQFGLAGPKPSKSCLLGHRIGPLGANHGDIAMQRYRCAAYVTA